MQGLIKSPISKEWHFSAHPEPHLAAITIRYHCHSCEREKKDRVEGPFWEVKGYKDLDVAEEIASQHIEVPEGWERVNHQGIPLLLCDNCLQNKEE